MKIGSRVLASSAFALTFLLTSFVFRQTAEALSSTPSTSAEKPFVVEYYYKVKWGYADEFLTLFEKNHYPLLQKQVEMGRMLKVSAVQPRYHSTEDGRWDYRVTIVFKNATVANDSSFDEKALIQQMYPDQATYKKEEQRRFEILEGHWDLPIKDLNLNSK